MQHIAVSVSDGFKSLQAGKINQAFQYWFNEKNWLSLQSVIEEAKWLPRL
jgi:hypothetical protein